MAKVATIIIRCIALQLSDICFPWLLSLIKTFYTVFFYHTLCLLILLKNTILFYVYEYVICIYACTPRVSLISMEARKEGATPIKTELCVVVSHSMGAGSSYMTLCVLGSHEQMSAHLK